MNAVLYYSNTGESKRIAEYFAERTGYALFDLTTATQYDYGIAVIVFPVHCQNIPRYVHDFLSNLKANYLVPIATYGKMSYGSVLYEIQRKYDHTIIAAAYVPTKHAYLLNDIRFDDFKKLAPLFDKLTGPTAVKIPKSSKNPFASFAPAWRSRKGVKIQLNANCNACGQCNVICPEHAMNCGKTNSNCIRCLRCIDVCPQGALTYRLRLPLRKYLKNPKTTDLVIYV